MNESKTTFIFVGVAAVMALAAFGSHWMNQPTNSADFEMVGKPFFEDFTSASQAQSLEVAAVDPESARLKRFSVENQSGLWRIPSHYNYPAEAAVRLATTASSVIGIGRESLAGRLAKEHERLGVLDPLADDIEDPEGVGKRITLKDNSGDVVVDYIVGKEAGDVNLSDTEQPFGNNGNEKYYYVRRPDEPQTYKVKLNIDLSTKFSDWIDPDLLRVERNNVTKIVVDNYSLEEDRSNPLAQNKALFKSQGDKLELARKSNTDAWELADLNPAEEELQTSRINEILGVVDQMKIAGVRPKYKYKDHLLLTADLKLNTRPEFKSNPQEFSRAINRLQNELDQKGFNLAGNAEKMELVSQNGDLEIGTDQGVVYTLHVGKAFDGDESEIEIGSLGLADDSPNSTEPADNSDSSENADAINSTDEAKSDSDPTDDTGADVNADGQGNSGAEEAIKEAKNRYLMVRVSFDESLIIPQPVEPQPPVKPVAPEGYTPPPQETGDSDDAETASTDGDAVEKPPGESEPERDPEFVKHDEAIHAYLDQTIDFELAKTQFDVDTEKFNKKIEEGKKLVDELNERFGDWYYVITGDNLATLQTQRKDVVTELEKPSESDIDSKRPDISFPALPNATQEPVEGSEGDDKGEDAKEDPKLEVEGQPEMKPLEVGKEEPAGDKVEGKGETKDGETKDGETQEGETKDGESKDGETKDSESKDGDEVETPKVKTEGGKTKGGKTEGGKTEGGKTEGDTTEGDTTEGGKTEGGKTEGGKTEGGKTEGGKTEGGKTEGDTTEGGKTEGDTTEGGKTEG